MKFKVGDIVKIKWIKSPEMVVTSISEEFEMVGATWFNASGNQQMASHDQDVFELVTTPPEDTP